MGERRGVSPACLAAVNSSAESWRAYAAPLVHLTALFLYPMLALETLLA
jgi:hypothetical protein